MNASASFSPRSRWLAAAAVVAACGALDPAAAAELRLLSGGAVEPGLKPAIAAFEAASGHRVQITFNAAPQIATRLGAGEAWDAVIAPVGVLEGAAKDRKVGAERVGIGRVGVGVAIREGAPLPEIGDAESLVRSVARAEAVVFNRASTGLVVERVFRDLGIADAVAAKAVRTTDGAQVMERLKSGQGREIGFGAITEILLFRGHGVRYVGPLPPAVQTYTTYAAAIPATSAQPAAARQLLEHLSGRAAQATFEGAGIDPAP
jgi:molybdate transport system substrate-binding protein